MDESSGVLLEEIGGRDALPLQHCIRQILRKFVLVNECACGGVNIYHWHDGVPFAKRRQTQPCPDGLRHLYSKPAPRRTVGKMSAETARPQFCLSFDCPCFWVATRLPRTSG